MLSEKPKSSSTYQVCKFGHSISYTSLSVNDKMGEIISTEESSYENEIK